MDAEQAPRAGSATPTEFGNAELADADAELADADAELADAEQARSFLCVGARD